MLFETQAMLSSVKKQEVPARCRLTCCLKPSACSFQQQAGRASQRLTYKLFKTQSMLFSATPKKGEPDADLPTVENPSMLLSATSRKASYMLTYTLFKTQGMLLSATSRKGQLNADIHPVQNPERALVSNKQEGPVRC